MSNIASYLQGFSLPATPEFEQPTFQVPVNANLASEFHHRLVESIKVYDAKLDEAHEVGIRLVSFGQAVTFRLHDLGYWNPSLMIFYGTLDNGDAVELIQHVSQISILLTTLSRLDTSKPKTPIGFKPQSGDAAV